MVYRSINHHLTKRNYQTQNDKLVNVKILELRNRIKKKYFNNLTRLAIN